MVMVSMHWKIRFRDAVRSQYAKRKPDMRSWIRVLASFSDTGLTS